MNPAPKPHVLCVDDEPQVLESLKLNLRRLYTVSTAAGGAEALALLDEARDVAVIVSDMRMPSMNGAAFLAQARHKAPDAVRLLLTGQSDIESAISAVNDGQVFRFLSKPCAPTVLLDAVASAVTQHRLITSERVLLQQTLLGSIQALTEMLAMVNPIAFGRSVRIRKLAGELADQVGMRERWQLEVAAMLSQIGHATLPPDVAEKAYYGAPLSADEERLVQGLPALVEKMLAHIPRLEVVLAILRLYPVGHGGAADTRALGTADALVARQGASVLRLAIDHDILESADNGTPFDAVLRTLRGRVGTYAPALLDALEAVRGAGAETGVQHLTMRELRVGMVFAEDVKTPNGVLLVARGYQITARVLDRIQDFSTVGGTQVRWAVYR
ncbi:response regulator [Variovorax sp. PvP013]|uniref:response regulator n=1 Tax=Variovorax sp. PvP013 TaxID=3156435 RepID=UPI003D2351FC